MPPVDHGSLKCTRVLVKEKRQFKTLATLPLTPVLVSPGQLMGLFGVRKGSAGYPATDVHTVKAMAVEHGGGSVIILKMASTNMSVKGTVVPSTVIRDYLTFLYF